MVARPRGWVPEVQYGPFSRRTSSGGVGLAVWPGVYVLVRVFVLLGLRGVLGWLPFIAHVVPSLFEPHPQH